MGKNNNNPTSKISLNADLKNYIDAKFKELLDVINEKDKKIVLLESKIIILEKRVDSMEEKHEKEDKKMEIAVFSKNFQTDKKNININFVAEANNYLENGNKICENDIKSVKDYRPKNGPIIATVSNFATKLKLLKCKNRNFAVKNSLTHKETLLRKRANILKSKNFITKVWDYRGEIYFSSLNDERVRASDVSLAEVEQTGLDSITYDNDD